jgi:hypothetical protein
VSRKLLLWVQYLCRSRIVTFNGARKSRYPINLKSCAKSNLRRAPLHLPNQKLLILIPSAFISKSIINPMAPAEFFRESNCHAFTRYSNTNYLYIRHAKCIKRRYQKALDVVASIPLRMKCILTGDEFILQRKRANALEFAAWLVPFVDDVNRFQERLKPCSGRDEMCNAVLNDDWASHPTWASEDSGFVAHRKNIFEEALHRIEEERHDYDFNIEANSKVIQLLEPIGQSLLSMSAEDRQVFRMPIGLGGQSQAIYKRVLKKIYGDRGPEVVSDLFKDPSAVLPIVLARLKQKDEEWRFSQVRRQDLFPEW